MTQAQFRARFTWDTNPESGCWENIEGLGIVSTDYYPLMTLRRDEGAPLGKHGKSAPRVRVHRMIYVLWKGPIEKGLEIAHACDNPRCFNPEHLSLKSHRDNMQDMVSRGRQAHSYDVNYMDTERMILRAKLTPDDVRQIRSSKLKARELAIQFHVDMNTIYRARSGRHWSHII